VSGDRKQEWFLWCWGSTLFACVVSSFGVAFIYHLQMLLYALLGCICVATFEAKRVAVRSAEPPKQEGLALAFAAAGTDLPLETSWGKRQRTDS
jgi:hypothetical protein